MACMEIMNHVIENIKEILDFCQFFSLVKFVLILNILRKKIIVKHKIMTTSFYINFENIKTLY